MSANLRGEVAPEAGAAQRGPSAGWLLTGLAVLIYSQFAFDLPNQRGERLPLLLAQAGGLAACWLGGGGALGWLSDRFLLFSAGLWLTGLAYHNAGAERLGLGLLLAGVVGLVASAARLFWRERGQAGPESSESAPPADRIPARAWVLVGLGLVLSACAALLAGGQFKAEHFWPSLLAWLAGILLVARAGWQGRWSGLALPRLTLLVLLDLLAAALLLRLILLGTIPVIFTGDEAGFGRVALQIVNGEINNLFTAPYMGGTNLPYLYDLIQAGGLALLGRNAFAFRLSSALAGTASVAALFWVAERMFDRRTAFFAALLLAGNHLYLHFSRYAISNVFDGLFFILVVGLLWDAWQTGERKKYLLGGLALGFSQYFYTSARALPVLALGFFALALLLDRPRLRASAGRAGLYWAAMLAVFLPMIVYYVQQPNMFIAPWSRVGQDVVRDGSLWNAFTPANLGVTAARMIDALLGFTHLPLQWLYRPGVAVLRPLTALLFLVGLALLPSKGRWARLVLLALWMLAFAAIGGLSDSTPASQRYVAVVPVLALIAGHGASQLARLAGGFFPSARAGLVMGVVASLLVVGLAASDARFYFFRYTPEQRYADPDGLAVQRLTDYLQDKTDEWQVIFVGYPNMHHNAIPTLTFLNPQITRFVSVNSPEEMDAVLLNDYPRRVYFFAWGHEEDLEKTWQAYPSGKLRDEMSYIGEVIYSIYEVGP